MARRYDRRQYLQQIRLLRQTIPGMRFSADFIVGFPGETERDFQATLSLLEQVRFDSIFSFVYSPRRYTKAHAWSDSIPLAVKKDRLQRLQALQREIQIAENRRLIGTTLEVLVTGPHPKKADEVVARSESYRVVNIAGQAPEGSFRQVRITAAGPHSLRGVFLD
jgi:tRNA-2-methylthio-N6-dimethylallyladenosine synthase